MQVDIAARVTEGANAAIAVTLKASVAAGTTSATAVTVTVGVEHKQDSEDATSEPADVSLNPATATLTFPANTTGGPVTHEVGGTILLQTNHDPDAEDETVVLAISASGGDISIGAGSGTEDEPRRTVILDDDEVQSYVLARAPGAAPREGAPFDVVVSAEPAHVDDSKTLTLQVDGTDDTTVVAEISGRLDGTTRSTRSAWLASAVCPSGASRPRRTC